MVDAIEQRRVVQAHELDSDDLAIPVSKVSTAKIIWPTCMVCAWYMHGV